MASPFTITLSMPESPADAQARAANELTNAAKAVGLRLTGRAAGELQYKTSVQFPFTLRLWHTLNGEKMTIRFEPGESGGTRVTINGAVARGKHPLASDPEHWTESLGGSTAAAG
jgi:hypothetical protein